MADLIRLGSSGFGTFRIDPATGEVFHDPSTPGGWPEGVTEDRLTVAVRDAAGAVAFGQASVDVTRPAAISDPDADLIAAFGSLLREAYPIRLGYLWQDAARTTLALENDDPVRAVDNLDRDNAIVTTEPATLRFAGGKVYLDVPDAASFKSASSIAMANQQGGFAFGARLRNATDQLGAFVTMGSFGFSTADPGAFGLFAVSADAAGTSRIRIYSGPSAARDDNWIRGTDDVFGKHITFVSRAISSGATGWYLNGALTTSSPSFSTYSGAGDLVTAPLKISGDAEFTLGGTFAVFAGGLDSAKIAAATAAAEPASV